MSEVLGKQEEGSVGRLRQPQDDASVATVVIVECHLIHAAAGITLERGHLRKCGCANLIRNAFCAALLQADRWL